MDDERQEDARIDDDALHERPAFYRWEGFVKHGPADVVKAVEDARKRRGRI